jgi:hypothetical protein
VSSTPTHWSPPEKPAAWWTPAARTQRTIAGIDRQVDLRSRVELARAEVAVTRVNAKAMVAASVMEAGCRLVDYGRFLAQDDPMKAAIVSTVAADFVADQRRDLFWS